MEPKKCEGCQRHLIVEVVCRWCKRPVNPMSTSVILIAAMAIFLLGTIVGSLAML